MAERYLSRKIWETVIQKDWNKRAWCDRSSDTKHKDAIVAEQKTLRASDGRAKEGELTGECGLCIRSET